MGLDADFLIEELWGPVIGSGKPLQEKKDGWPVYKTQLGVLHLSKCHHIHGWACKLSRGEANKCYSVELDLKDLKELEFKLKQFATDPEAMPPCPKEYWGAFFGVRPGDEGYEEELAYHQGRAPEIAKQIRKMWKYIEKKKEETKEKDFGEAAWVYGVYKASW